jgi:hypothetical protein
LEVAQMIVVDVGSLDDGEIEAELCSLAGHIAAATARMVLLLAEFDRRGAFGRWGCSSTAHWMTWKCAMSARAARERLRVGRALEILPVIRGEFSAGRLSYSQVRALTRVATPETDAAAAKFAQHCTASQLETAVRATSSVKRRRDTPAAVRVHEGRRVSWRHDEDGALRVSAVLEPDVGARLITALHAFDKPPQPGETLEPAATRLADAIDSLIEAAMAHPDRGRDGGDRTLVIIHTDHATLTNPDHHNGTDTSGNAAGVTDTSSEPELAARRCHIERGPAIAPETARRLACDSAIVHITQHDGEPLSVGRKTRTIPAAIRRAVKARDKYCRFPGCNRPIRQIHHVKHWTRDLGPTATKNSCGLCDQHHWAVHEGGYDVQHIHGTLRFTTPDGRELHNPPTLTEVPSHTHINHAHPSTITPTTITPNWNGDQLTATLAIPIFLPPHTWYADEDYPTHTANTPDDLADAS